jgi:hypothetical protein
MDIPPPSAKLLFLLSAVLYAGMGVVLLAQSDGEPPEQRPPSAVTALIDSLPPTASGPAQGTPSVSAPSTGTARRDCQPLVAN